MNESRTPFETFWQAYPHRVGKLAAQKAHAKALRSATPGDILAGVQRYVRTKPDWQTWAHPTSWLNAGRWMDQIGADPARTAGGLLRECPHQPPCETRWSCGKKQMNERES